MDTYSAKKIIVLITLLSVIFCACSRESLPSDTDVVYTDVYVANPLSAPEMLAEISSYQPFVQGDSLYLYDSFQETYLYRFALDGAYMETLSVPSLYEKDLSLRQVLLLQNGDYLGLAADTEQHSVLVRFSADGEIRSRADLTEEIAYFSQISMADDKVLLLNDAVISVFSDTLVPVAQFSLDFLPQSMRIVSGERTDTVYLQGDTLYTFDMANGTCTKVYTPNGIDNETGYAGTGYDYYILNNDGIYGISDGERTLLCHLGNSGLLRANIESFLVLSDSVFYIRYRDAANGTRYSYILTPSTEEERIPVRIACIGRDGTSDAFRSIVQQFNTSGTPYMAEIVNYNQYGLRYDDTGAIDQFRKDLLDGAQYDLYVLDSYFCAEIFSTLTDNGSLCDLSALCENVLPSIQSAYTGTKNGSMTGIPFGLCYICLSAPADRYSTMDTLRQMAALCDTDTVLCSENIRYQLISVYVSSMLRGNGTCAFDTPDFVAFLELCQKIDGAASQKYGTLNRSSADGKRFLSLSSAHFFEAVQSERLFYVRFPLEDCRYLASYKLLYGDMPSHLVGFPDADGESRAYGFVSANLCMPMRQGDSLGATAFLTYYLSDTVQNGETNLSYQFPLTEAALEKATEARYYYYTVEEIGNINIQPHSRYVERPANPPSETNEQVREVHLTDAEIETFRDLIRTAIVSTGRDDMVTQIISEELEPFFAGDRSAEDTAEIIQKRASIYLAE